MHHSNMRLQNHWPYTNQGISSLASPQWIANDEPCNIVLKRCAMLLADQEADGAARIGDELVLILQMRSNRKIISSS